MTGMIYPAIIMGGLGLIFGALLAFASKKFHVETDPRQANIRAILPGANCGGCGYPGAMVLLKLLQTVQERSPAALREGPPWQIVLLQYLESRPKKMSRR